MQRFMLLVATCLLVSICGVSFGEQTVTVRVGEQDTCTVRGACSVEKSTVTFDLSKLKDVKAVKCASLRFWVKLGKRAPLDRTFTVNRWSDPKFDGFKVWQIGKEEKPLAVIYPFTSSVALHEWDVTAAVKDWVADPASNKGLKSNFSIPANTFEPAWQRPYLQVEYTGGAAKLSKQPAEAKAVYRSGQVFITWKQPPYDGAFFDSTFRVYKHTEPITAANLDKAEWVGEVNKNSQLNYRRSAYSYGGLTSYGSFRHFWNHVKFETKPLMSRPERVKAHNAQLPKRYNFVIDDAWPKSVDGGKWLSDHAALGNGAKMMEGPMLSDDTGLFVHTVKKPGKLFFAITSVIEGQENRTDIAAGNAIATGIDVKVETPRPVLQVLYRSKVRKGSNYHLRQYAFWGGGDDDLHIEPSTPFIFQINTPLKYVGDTKAKAPSYIATGGIYWPCPLVAFDRTYIPPTRNAPWPSLHCSLNDTGWPHAYTFYRAARDAADPKSKGGFYFPSNLGTRKAPNNAFGYHNRVNTGADPRQASVRPYFENRILKTLEHFFAEFPQADRNRVMFKGEGTAFLMGIHHPDVIATVDSGQFAPWSAKWNENQWRLVGKREWDLKNEKGFSIWNWNDPIWYSRKFPTLAWPFISNCQSPNYARADDLTHWQNCGYPQFYLDLEQEKRGGRWWWCDIGDAPNGKPPLVPLNTAYPAFTNVNFSETPHPKWRKDPRGTLNGYLVWGANGGLLRKLRHKPAEAAKVREAMKSVDVPDRFELAIRIGTHGLRLNGQSVPPSNAKFGKTDITLWRLQQFKIEKGKTYRWANRRCDNGQVIQTGTAQPDERGLLTVSGFLVDRDPIGNKLVITPDTDKAPEIDKATKINVSVRGEKLALDYADYVNRCTNPVLCPPVTLPSTTFKVSEFTLGGKTNADGSRTFRDSGGFGMGRIKTTVKIPKAGPYVIAVRAKAKKAEAGNWPLINLNAGGIYGRKFPARIIDSTDWDTYRWYATLAEGKLDIDIATPSDYYMHAQLPSMTKGRGLQVADMTITGMTEEEAAKKAVEIRVSPRGIAVPEGLPTQLVARVLNGLGKTLDTKIAWACEGAEVSASGVFKAPKEGTFTVTATSGELKQSIVVNVGKKLNETFNEGCGSLRPAWTTANLSAEKGRWITPNRGHHMLNSLWMQARKPAKSVLLFSPGAVWQDYEMQADIVIVPKVRTHPDGTRGLVVRAKDKDNLYRLEIKRAGKDATARLIKRVAGKESVLNETKEVPPYAPFDYNSNPMCPGWHKWVEKQGAALKTWRLDRVRVLVKGDTIRAWLNGKELFPGGVKDPDLKTGTAGLYAENPACFDNVEIGPVGMLGPTGETKTQLGSADALRGNR